MNDQVRDAHVFSTPPGYPNSQTGTCRCGLIPLNSTRSAHARHVLEVITNHSEG